MADELPLPASGQPALRIHGSNTIGASLSPALLNAMLGQRGFRDINSSSPRLDELHMTARAPDGTPVSFQLASHGTRSGFQAMQQGSADMTAASRAVSDEEAGALSSLGEMRSPDAEHVIAIDGLAIITHPSNPLTNLSTEQLAAIFSGKVKNWSEVGGNNGPIHLYARDQNSGTWDTFRSLVLDSRKLKLDDSARRYESSEQLSDLVSNDPQAIGFISLPYIRQARALAISDGSSKPMPPSPELVASEDYPLSRRLFLYAPTSGNLWAKALAEFAGSDAGQEIVADLGFVPQSVLAIQVKPAINMPTEYQELARSARRLSTTFRFAEGSTELDAKAVRDIERVVDYLKSHDKVDGKVTLVGFGDPASKDEHSLLISRLRAITVQRHLSRAGLLVRDNLGMGDIMPVASNDTEEGRIRNRRVEVWVH